jgi:TRAP-type C4-dicarboxylate transport system permease small subunit
MSADGVEHRGPRVSPVFNIVLIVFVVLMFACLIAAVWMSIQISKPDAAEQTALDNLWRGFTGTLGFLLGLFGGKLA